MGILVWLIVGGVVGWLASIVMRTDAQQGILLNVVVGIVGALLAGFIGAWSPAFMPVSRQPPQLRQCTGRCGASCSAYASRKRFAAV